MFNEINPEIRPFPEIIPDVSCDRAIEIAEGIYNPPTEDDLLAIATLNHHAQKSEHTPHCPSRHPFSGVPTPSTLPGQIMSIEPGSTTATETENQ